MNAPTVESSKRLSGICAAVLAVLMIALRKVFRMKAEATFLGGFFGAILFFFLIIFVGNTRAARGDNKLGWIELALCEIVALIVSFIVHPVCITTCILFSIPVVVYIKWAATKMSKIPTSSSTNTNKSSKKRKQN
ncbi:protein KRTCAP2 [Histomonas meleagridis]|uniref:protein KRTCAP2-like n=1 Tax=Histomonas meleagridis TaxID=135588 RepID=UPI00355A4191|nr:protein KRTCAP2 [Histomonas meleagridis]KAH0800047.1 protein KRTCAP2-like [Histomonas meleagridis]